MSKSDRTALVSLFWQTRSLGCWRRKACLKGQLNMLGVLAPMEVFLTQKRKGFSSFTLQTGRSNFCLTSYSASGRKSIPGLRG